MFPGPLPPQLDQGCCSSNLTAPAPFLSPGRCQADNQGADWGCCAPTPPRITVQLGHIPYLRCSQWFQTFQESWFGCSLQAPALLSCLPPSHTGPWREVSGSESFESAQVWLQTWGRGLFQPRSIFWDLEGEVFLFLELLLQAEGTCRVKPSEVLGVPSTRQEKKGMAFLFPKNVGLQEATWRYP